MRSNWLIRIVEKEMKHFRAEITEYLQKKYPHPEDKSISATLVMFS